MSNRMWENTVEHAKTCVLGGKLYVYYAAGTHSTGVVFNNVYEPRGLISDGQFLSLDSLNHNQKVRYSLPFRIDYNIFTSFYTLFVLLIFVCLYCTGSVHSKCHTKYCS